MQCVRQHRIFKRMEISGGTDLTPHKLTTRAMRLPRSHHQSSTFSSLASALSKDIHQETTKFRHEERQIAHAGCMDVVALKQAI
ncbi:hypothetical protein M404DRAFT_741060 [Pisolithus tinctorius Marx 270]|uniref:Uncharacterized protein n=1 Tax=Pisolithus tinctorius Marx 270 TaxID=870435 RepID=A0A0C3P124_PISTI|nr:hypothetical protein M404DRAFT_741060 [Pisolithus tinctorius Marx 270]